MLALQRVEANSTNMIATPMPSAPLGNNTYNSDDKTLNVSSNTSGGSTASSVLIRSTKPPTKTESSLSGQSDRRLSSSSFSSTNSQRVSIKARYLREVKSPFEVDGQSEQEHDDYIPPALPGNLPVDYAQRRDIADTVNHNQSELHVLSLDNKKDNHLPEQERIFTGDGAVYKSIRVGLVDSSKEKVAFRTNSKPSSSSSLLKQGAPTSSHAILSNPAGPSNGVRITQFALGGKQKVLKDQLLKRQEQTAPVKRYIRPTMVGMDQRVSSTIHGHPESNMAEEFKNPSTVAAVTAAAVAATVPIVKAQTDLETKMDTMMEKLVLLQELTNRGQHPLTHQPPEEQHTTAVTNPTHQGGDLQKTLDEAMNKRLQQLEKIQERQFEWQEKLMSAAYQPRLESHSTTSSHAYRPTKSQFDSNHIGPEDKQPLKEDSHRIHPGLSAHAASAVRPDDKQPFKDQQRGFSHERLEKNAKRHNRYTPAVTLHSYPPQQATRKAPNEGVFSSDNDTPVDKTAHQPSPLDTPAPRRHAPRPLTQNGPPKISHAGRGLLEEILTSHDEEERRLATRGRQIPTSSYPKPSHSSVTRGLISPESGAETKAAGVVHQLGKLKKEMKEMKIDLIKSLHSEGAVGVLEQKAVPSTVSDIHQEAERDWDRLMQRRLEPAPLDVYLRKRPSVPVTLPASSHLKPPLSPSQYNAPIPSSMCADARAVLDQVQSSRACLQANLEAVIRAKEQEEFYNYMDSLHLQGEAAEKAQLRYKVGRMIAAIDEEIKHEVPIKPRNSQSTNQGVGNNKSEKPSNLASSASRPVKTGTKKKPVSSRIDSGLRNQTTSKGDDKNMVKGRHNKENFAQTKKLPISQARRQPTVDHNQDEAYLTRVYGKAMYQMRRSTMKKEPYLKYSTSSPQTKPGRSLSAAQVKGTEMKSAKTQTVHKLGTIPVPNPNSQFFFDPYPTLQATSTLQQEEPAHQPAPLTAPSHGQLIPMAVPLGPPQRGGLTQPVTIKTDGLERGVVKELERRDVQSNVAVVNVKSEKKPRLTVQQLPSVDIDTEPPSSASSVIEHDQSPKRDGRAEICEPDDSMLPGRSSPSHFPHYLAVADEDVEPQDESEDELPAPGISLPGHYSETRRPYHGPPFPPQAPPSIPSRAGPSSEQLAADMRKDLIESKALDWIEQELMARMISELYSKQPAVQPRPDSPDSSVASSSNDSIIDSIGPAGLQLFVDAGQAVDHTLVSALVREVLEEKVTSVLGQHDRDIPRQQASPTPQATASPIVLRSPIPTPEVTPQPSPVHTPPRAASLVATPLASPSHSSPAESETENLEDLARTMDATASDEPIAAPAAHVATPINTPPPSPPPDIATPPLSPRESPKLISVIDGSIITPVPTPQPVSPEPEIEESVELPTSPEPVVVEEEPIPPTPTPSLLTPSTPTPSLSTATTTQPSPSTETAGRSISEGEWLISAKSDGQIDFTEDEPGVIGLPEISSSPSIDSTLMGAEELEKDVQDDELSEGEISPVKRTPRLHTRDPVVAILAHMSQRPDPSAAPPYFPSQTLHNNGTKSLGEVSIGQCPNLTPSSERMLFKEAYGTNPPELTPRSEVRREVSGGEQVRREVSDGEQPDTVRQLGDDFTLRVSHLERTDVEDETDEPDTAATVQTKQAKPHPAPRIIQVVGKRPSPSPEPDDDNGSYPSNERYGDSRRRGEVDEDEEEDEEEYAGGGIHGRRGLPPRASIPSNLFGTQTMSDLGSRTLTPDALNLEALLQSGYLSQTFSQSEGGTSDFESLRPMGQTLGSTGPTFHQAPYDDMQNITEGSLELPKGGDPEARIPGMMSFSVTLPSAVESQGIDLSQTISEGEIPVPDTISDVSELSGGDL